MKPNIIIGRTAEGKYKALAISDDLGEVLDAFAELKSNPTHGFSEINLYQKPLPFHRKAFIEIEATKALPATPSRKKTREVQQAVEAIEAN